MGENEVKKAYSKVVNRPLVPLIALAVLLIMCFFSYKSSKPSRSFHANSADRLISQKSKGRELEQILRRASMMDKTVILSIVDEEWASSGSVLDLFLESFKTGKDTQKLVNHLVIVTLGIKAFQYCITIHPYCFQLNTSLSKLAPNYYLHFWRQRNSLLLEVIELGYNFIFTEADVMWFRNPISEFHSGYEVSIPCDDSSSQSESNNNKARSTRGLFYVKSNAVTVELFRFWRLVGYLYPNSHFESLCEILGEQEVHEMLDVRVKYLDTTYFGGFCQQNNNINGVYTMHANCCDDKLYDLRLVLDHWQNFTTTSSNVRTIAFLDSTKRLQALSDHRGS